MILRNLFYSERKELFSDEVFYCGETILKTVDLSAMLGVNVFVDAVSESDFSMKKSNVTSIFNKIFEGLPINVVAQSAGEVIAVEVWTDRSAESICYKQIDDMAYAVYSSALGRSVLALGLASLNLSSNLKEQSTEAFEKILKVLNAEGFSMDNVVRQWNYIPQILDEKQCQGATHQNYQVFNDVRQHYYDIYKNKNSYPAATGIGVRFGNVTIDFLAVQPSPDVLTVGLTNPRQIDAFDYSQEYLVGSSCDKKPPLFERAKLLVNQVECCVFVSGTASILGEDTVGIDDIVLQTKVTLENIDELTKLENLKRLNIDQFESKQNTFNRVYIKRQEHFEKVKEICRAFYGDSITLYVNADVCRDKLLVEIESEYLLYNIN